MHRHGPLTYCDSCKQRLEKGIILCQKSQDIRIAGDIDEDREGIFRYRLYTLDQCVLVFWESKDKGAAHSIVLNQQLQIFYW